MDSNLSIIELVKRRPGLYTRCKDFPGRARQWKEVADILKTDVSLVKSRWHLLRERFIKEYSSVLKGNRSTFKYLTDMSFLSNHINLEAFEMYSKENDHYRTQPEFNITKKDLEDTSDDDDSTGEFIELELDEESHRELAQIPFGVAEESGQNVYVEPIFIDEYSNASQSLEGDLSQETEEKQQQVELFVEVPSSTPPTPATPSKSQDDKSSIVKKEEKPKKVDKVKTEKNVPVLETNCKNEPNSSSTKSEEKPPVSLEKPKSENLRCEDTIFGELVTATLRQMHTDKKKAVKREIMNLLFT